MWNLGYVLLQFSAIWSLQFVTAKAIILETGDCASFVWSANGYAIFHSAKWFFLQSL
jgi:hypothetical protein